VKPNQVLVREAEFMNQVNALMAEVDRRADELVELLRWMIRIETVNTGRPPTGNEIAVAAPLRDWLAGQGIGSRLIEPAPGRAILIASLKGQEPGPRLMYMAHTDVVPIEDPATWMYPPFSAEISEGRVWGRGALDCKGMVACEAMAMAILAQSGWQPQGELRLAITADEEAGSVLGAKWLAENMPEEMRCDYALNEGPGLPIQTQAGCGYLLPVGGKGAVDVHLTFHGRSYHSSQPWRADNALLKMADAALRIARYQPAKDVSNPIFGFLDRLFGIPGPVTAENLDEALMEVEKHSVALAHRLMALSRLSLAPTMAHSGIKENNIPERADLTVNSRILPGQSGQTVQRILEDLLSDIDGVEIDCRQHAEPSSSPHDTPFAAAVQRSMSAATGRNDIFMIPTLMGGCADSRYIRPLGAVVYDFFPFHPGADIERYMSHTANESIEIQSLIDSTKMMVALAVDLLTNANRTTANQ
jgi:acetylornithine deacetylase/succinyl-diaminopimelate desuccinylase-like protein